MADIKHIVPFTYKWEGGLSRDPNDNAASNPSPYKYNNVYGWHTNKGITYSTFKENTNLGYVNNADNFLKMPENIWMLIAKKSFWDKLKLDNMESQAIANLMFSWIWGSGLAWRNRIVRYFKTKNIVWDKSNYDALVKNFNSLVKKETEQKIFDELVEQYREFYKSLDQPRFEKGWLNRLDDLKTYSYNFIKNINKTSSFLIILLVITGYLLYKNK